MLQYVTVQQMRKIDQKAVVYGMSVELMMENAGREICNQILKKIYKHKIKKILIIAGKGNNGGGVIAAARHLAANGISSKLVVLGNKNNLSASTKLNLHLVRKNPKIQILFYSKNLEKILHEIKNSKLILDGIFGIGLNKNITEPYYSIISAINNSNAFIFSNDVPSGIDADSGDVFKIAVKSDFLIVLHKPKKWMSILTPPKFTVVSLGIPIEIIS
ncbi:MAG: NAD(P)H-hydrate epimerase [Nitrosopumilus sp.]